MIAGFRILVTIPYNSKGALTLTFKSHFMVLESPLGLESLMMAGCIVLLSIGVCAMGLSLYATATRGIK